MICAPVSVEPVNAILSTPGCLTRCAADRRARAGDDVDRARREPDLGRELGHAERRQRRLRVGLEDDGAAGRQRRRELPGRHHQRVVPGDDLAGDADGLLQRVEEERAAERVRPARDGGDRGRVEAEVLDRLVELGLHRRDRLADVPHLELRQLLAVGDERVGERVQQTGALGRRRPAPVALERRARRLDCSVDVGLGAHRDLGQRLAGRGLDELPQVAAGSLRRLAVDEEQVLTLGRDRHEAGRYRVSSPRTAEPRSFRSQREGARPRSRRPPRGSRTR